MTAPFFTKEKTSCIAHYIKRRRTMARYKVNYTIERWYAVEVEANSEEEARQKFYDGEYEDDSRDIGSELQDSVQVEELEEASV